MAHKKWITANADKEKASLLSEKLNIDPLIAFLLVSRGIDDELKAKAFLTDTYALGSPFSFKDMDKAASRINAAIEKGEKICIFGDYDCDGVTSVALLFSFFESLGADVIYYIPNRLTEGYGMNINAVDKIKSMGTDLIVTVDNGISAFEEAEYIYQNGMQLVVTDHHQIGDKLPKAEAVVNPHREDNDIRFSDFAGVGVAFKLACAIYEGDTQELLEQYADLVAIGTIGDMVSLTGENRALVKTGIELINSDSRLGVAALRKAAGIADKNITATGIAFQICPRINAAGRMDSADRALELLISDYYETAEFKAQQLNDENLHRQQVENNIVEDILRQINENPSLENDRVIVAAGENYHSGVIGIAASNIVSCYGKPTIVISVGEAGECIGSARSIDGFNIYEAIASCKDILNRFGGHPLAAGIGIDSTEIDAFRKRINDYAREAYSVMPVETLTLDIKLSPFYLDLNLVDALERLEPYGKNNSQPVFGLFNMTLENVIPIGEGKHIRLELGKKGKIFRAVKFGTPADKFSYSKGEHIDLAVKAVKNFFKGRYSVSLQVVDVRKNGIDDDRYFTEKSDYELFKSGFKNKTELYPYRNVCTQVYRFLKSRGGYKCSFDDLYFSLGQSITYGQLKFALEAFSQAGLITIGDEIKVNTVEGKTNLDNTEVLKSLKGRM